MSYWVGSSEIDVEFLKKQDEIPEEEWEAAPNTKAWTHFVLCVCKSQKKRSEILMGSGPSL